MSPLLVVAACSSDETNDTSTKTQPIETPDGASPDASSEIVPADTTMVVATAKGGSPMMQSDASTCRSADNTFTLVPSTRKLTWKSCTYVPTDGSPWSLYEFVDGEKTLTEAEYGPLSSALHALVPSTKGCGADKPTLTVSITTPSGTVAYVDDFYACNQHGLYVDGMDAVFEQFDKLTSSSSK